MVKVGRKAAELEWVKLKTEIQKEKSEIRRKQLENKLKMSKAGGKGGPAKKKVMIARAEQKVEAIRQAKQKVGQLKAIDEVVFAQNVPKYNPEWEHSPNGRATAYLATLVCRYMHELQQKDKKVVLSAKVLETIYHTASSSIGKLISGKQYLGGAALEQLHDKVEAEGKELPFKKKKKLPQRLSGLVKTSGTASKD